MGLLQIIVGLLLILLGGFVTTMNWGTVFQWLWRKKHSSWIPVVGGALAAAGAAIVPYAPLNAVWWAPLFLDWGCIPGLVVTGAFYLWRSLTKKRNTMS